MKQLPPKKQQKRPLEHLTDDELNRAIILGARQIGNTMKLEIVLHEINYRLIFKNKDGKSK